MTRKEVYVCDYCGKQIDTGDIEYVGAIHFRDPIDCGDEGPDYPCYAEYINEMVVENAPRNPFRYITDMITGKRRKVQTTGVLEFTGKSFCNYNHLSLFVMDRTNELLSAIEKKSISNSKS